MTISAATLNVTTQIIGANLVTDALYKVNSLVQQATAGSEQAYKSYENLSRSLQSLVARERVRANSTLSMRDAMAQAEGQAQRLLGWTQRLAIESPFTQEGVASAFRMAQAYGFVSESANKTVVSAKRLTEAVIDYAAASGRGEEVMSRVALALGQIQAKGRLQGDEMLQLTEAGINVRDILARAFKTTTDEVIRMSEKGLIPANKAVLAIVEGLEKDFGGAAQNSANTLEGLQASLSDIVQVMQRRATAPVFDVYKAQLKSFVDYLQSPEVGAKIDMLAAQGKAFAENVAGIIQGAMPSFQALVALAEGTAKTVGALVGQIAGSLGQLTGVKTPQDLGGQLVPGILAVGAALQFRAKMEDVVARNAERRAKLNAMVAAAEKQVTVATQARATAEQNLADVMGNQYSTPAEREGAQNQVQQAENNLLDAQAQKTRALGQAKRSLGQTTRQLVSDVRSAAPAFLAQAASMALVSAATYAMMQAWQTYQQQVGRQSQSVFAAQDKEIARLEELLNGPDKSQQSAEQNKADALKKDAAEQIAALKEMKERFRQETADDAQKTAIVQMAAELGKAISEAIAYPFQMVAIQFGLMLRNLLAAIPGTQQDLAKIDQELQAIANWKFDGGAFQGMIDQTNEVAIANARARQAALDKAAADAEAAIQAGNRAQAEALLAMELTKQQTDALSNIAKLEVDYAQGQLDRRREFHVQLEDMARSHGKSLASIEESNGKAVQNLAESNAKALRSIAENRQKAIRDLAKQSAKDAIASLDQIINADVAFQTGLRERRSAFDEEQAAVEGDRQEQVAVLRKQGAIRELRAREREWREQDAVAKKAFRLQEQGAAEAYARQLAAQQQHLGRMLIDYVRAQGTMMGVSGKALDAMTAAIAKEYGVQQSLAERSFGAQRQALDAWLQSGGKNTDAVIADLGRYRNEAVSTQMEIDRLTKERTQSLSDQFQNGAMSVDEYVRALQQVPQDVNRQVGVGPTGAGVGSDRLDEIERNAKEQTAAQKRAYAEQVAAQKKAYAEQVAAQKKAYAEQVEEAKKGFDKQEKAAFESYAKQRSELEKHLIAMNKMMREGVDARIRDMVRLQVALNESMRRQLEDLWKIREQLSPEEYDRRMRAIAAQAGATQATITDPAKTPPQQSTPRQLQRDYGPQSGMRAGGGTVWPGNTYLAGERGPELIRPLVPSMVYPNGTTPSGGGSHVTVNLNNVTVDSEARLQQLLQQIETKVLGALDKQVDGKIIEGIKL
jgi:tape measure domain-containing protein